MKIFVFGSNLAGRHGKGAALFAKRHHGAINGIGEGFTGFAYAIPTKDGRTIANLRDPRNILPLEQIHRSIEHFKAQAALLPELQFQVTRIGCGLAGYKPEQIAPMFSNSPPNVELPPEFLPFLTKTKEAQA
jgi:hypothetical protein